MGLGKPHRRAPRAAWSAPRALVFACVVVAFAGARFAASMWDGIVVSNVIFRGTKFLDVVLPPGTEDPAIPYVRRYLDAG